MLRPEKRRQRGQGRRIPKQSKSALLKPPSKFFHTTRWIERKGRPCAGDYTLIAQRSVWNRENRLFRRRHRPGGGCEHYPAAPVAKVWPRAIANAIIGSWYARTTPLA